MLPELGHFALIIALVFACLQGIVPLVGTATGRTQWMVMSRPLSWGQFLFLLISFVALASCSPTGVNEKLVLKSEKYSTLLLLLLPANTCALVNLDNFFILQIRVNSTCHVAKYYTLTNCYI